jgi:hypothetical protein
MGGYILNISLFRRILIGFPIIFSMVFGSGNLDASNLVPGTEESSKAQIDYLIVIDNENLEPAIRDFYRFKQSSGYKMALVKAEDIKVSCNDGAEKIRNFLVSLYKSNGLKYALLVGNPYDKDKVNVQNTGGRIPMKYLYPHYDNHAAFFRPDYYDYKNNTTAFNTPTDLYYALGIDWDLDKDGFSGELGEDITKQNPLAKPMYSVGRIPFNDAKTVKEVLSNTIEKEKGYERNGGNIKALAAAAISSYPENEKVKNIGDGAKWSEVLKANLSQHSSKFITLYEQRGLRSSKYKADYALTSDNFSREWNKGYDFIYAFGHGGVSSHVWAEDINKNGYTDYWAEVQDNTFLVDTTLKARNGFLFFDGCSTGIVEDDGTIHYETQLQDLLKKGLITAGIATSREIGFYPDKEDYKLCRYFFPKDGAMKTMGEMYYDAIINSFKDGADAMNLYPHSYYGDPTMKLLGGA